MKHIVDVTGTPVTANYVWDVNRSVPEILQDGTNTYVYGLGRISSTDGSGNQTYYTGDGLGSTTDLTDGSATKNDGYKYDVFGAPTHSPGSSANPFQFAGQQSDADSGMQYLRARYYDPGTGRFLGRDPVSGLLSKPSTQNPYAYALGNPLTSLIRLVAFRSLTSSWDCARSSPVLLPQLSVTSHALAIFLMQSIVTTPSSWTLRRDSRTSTALLPRLMLWLWPCPS